MKILRIRIKNLASLEGSTEIDFTQEPLSSAGIFAITGPTGAGKSTILDALCLALYSKTPRYLQARETGIDVTDAKGNIKSQGDVRGILRDGTGEGFAEVDFAGVDGHNYQATWRVRRARDKAEGSLQNYSVGLKNLDTNSVVPGRNTELQKEIERLVGLNFEQFTRSVLLAQGDFTAFLKAAKDEKSGLLEKLTGTQIYSEISMQIFANYKKEQRELEDLNLQRSGILTLTPEELVDFLQKKSSLEKQVSIHEREVELLTREINWHTQLSILQSSIEAAHNIHLQTNQAKQDSTLRELELKQVEHVQSIRTWVDSKQTAESQLAERTVSLLQLQTTLQELQKLKGELETQWGAANIDLAAKVQQHEESVPLLEEARTLDIQIREKTEQLNHASKEVKDAEEYYRVQEQQFQQLQDQVRQLLESIENLQQWKKENSARQSVAENFGLINSKLSDAGMLLDETQLLIPKLESAQNALDQTKISKIDLEEKLAAFTHILKAERDQYKTGADVLAAISISTFENEKIVVDVAIEEIITAQAHWKILSGSQEYLASLGQKHDQNAIDLRNKTEMLVQTTDQLTIITAERDASLRMLNKARVATADSVESLRSQLITGDECPVCGSTEHPYAIEHRQLNHILQQLEFEHEQHEKAYANCLATEGSLREAGNQLKKTIDAQELEISTRVDALATYEETWKNFAIYPKAVNVPDEEIATWLEQQFSEARTRQRELHTHIQSYATQKHELETLQNKINDLDRTLNEHVNALKDTERNLQSLKEQIAQYNKELLNMNKELSETELNLSVYFTAHGWFANWKENPFSFLRRISDFTDTWKINTQKLEEDTQQHAVMTATHKAAQDQLRKLFDELQKKKTAADSFTQQQDTLTLRRKDIFNGEAAATIELRLKQVVVAAQDELEKIKTKEVQLQEKLTRNGTQKEKAEEDIVAFQKQVDSFDIKIQEWLRVFNEKNHVAFEIEKIMHLLSLSPEWLENERAALRAIDDEVTKALSVLSERTTQLEQHETQRLSQRSTDELIGLFDTAKIESNKQLQEKNEIGFRLQQDFDNKQKIGELLGIIKAKSEIVENWAKLNEIIGSADGKKFRQIAQEYTLDVLLSYANIHLGVLSKRYLLQRIPNTLGLQVLDQDMGDEVRTVFSLSGGESFLVSLALALGLASLSSSSMQVESLFIDEGFGSLDPTTLNIAMDALERLHNQGRKVGVISHVQEMTERIPVQIRVRKESSGRSVVEVQNFI